MAHETFRPPSLLGRFVLIGICIMIIITVTRVMIVRAVPRQLTIDEQVHRAQVGCIDAADTDYFLIKHCSQCATDSDGSVWCRHTETVEF